MIKKILLLIFFCSCSSTSDFFHDGESKSHQICVLLQKVHSREDLVLVGDLLKKRFQELVDLMIIGYKYSEKHPEAYFFKENTYNDELLREFKRIYALEGCREYIESLQKEPLIRLDAYLNKRRQKKVF